MSRVARMGGMNAYKILVRKSETKKSQLWRPRHTCEDNYNLKEIGLESAD
jgi:hypothetical protein